MAGQACSLQVYTHIKCGFIGAMMLLWVVVFSGSL